MIIDNTKRGRAAPVRPRRSGSTVSIPAARARWEIKVGGPAGIDLVQAIASRRPLTLPEIDQIVHAIATNPTVSLGRSADDAARDLLAQVKPQPITNGGGGPQRVGVRNVLFRILPADASAAPGVEVPLASAAPAARSSPSA